MEPLEKDMQRMTVRRQKAVAETTDLIASAEKAVEVYEHTKVFSFFFSLFLLFIAFEKNPQRDERIDENSSLLNSRRRVSIRNIVCGLLSPV